jgi:undecaprenyl pyrophosphate phosphatase UppP
MCLIEPRFRYSLRSHWAGGRPVDGPHYRQQARQQRESMLPVVVVGTAPGLLAGLLFGKLVESQLFGVSATDPPLFVISAAALLAASLVPEWAAAWRAARIDPMAALRHD